MQWQHRCFLGLKHCFSLTEKQWCLTAISMINLKIRSSCNCLCLLVHGTSWLQTKNLPYVAKDKRWQVKWKFFWGWTESSCNQDKPWWQWLQVGISKNRTNHWKSFLHETCFKRQTNHCFFHFMWCGAWSEKTKEKWAAMWSNTFWQKLHHEKGNAMMKITSKCPAPKSVSKQQNKTKQMGREPPGRSCKDYPASQANLIQSLKNCFPMSRKSW